MEFSFVRLVFTILPDRPCGDPVALFDAGREFPDLFLEVAGVEAWKQVFAQELSSDPEAVRRHQKPPLPFAFSFPVGNAVSGVPLEVGLTLVGDAAVSFAPMFTRSLELLLSRRITGISGAIAQVESIGFSGDRSLVRDSAGCSYPPNFVSASDFLSLRPQDEVHLRLLTPLKLAAKGEGGLFDFSLFFRTLLRRISSLSSHYCSVELEADFSWLSARSREVGLTGGNFRRESWKSERVAGIVGEAGITGDLADLYPYLRLGEFFNCGKGAAYGLGRFRLG